MVLRWIFIVLFVLLAAYGLARLAVPRGHRWDVHGTGRDVDGAHAVMSIGMAAMFGSWLPSLLPAVWLVIFALAGGWFTAKAVSGAPGHTHHRLPVLTAHRHHIVAMLAMAYMIMASLAGGPPTVPHMSSMLGMSSMSGSMSGMSGAQSGGPLLLQVGSEVVTSAFALYFLFVAASAVLLIASRRGRSGLPGPTWRQSGVLGALLSIELYIVCEVIMAAGMTAMFAMML